MSSTFIEPSSDAVALAHCESRIAQAGIDLRAALREIRESRLYRAAGFDSFDAYCETRWNLGRRQVDRLIAWDQVAEATRPIGLEPARESHAREIADLAPEQQREVLRLAHEKAGEDVTAATIREAREELIAAEPTSRENSRRALTSSESNEWYTDEELVELAREVLGVIDLDPASSEEANEVVQANMIYTIENDGLAQPWFGRILHNPPYGLDDDNNSNQAMWSKKLLLEYATGDVEAAVLIVNAAVGARWFRPLWAYPICFPDGCRKFRQPKSATQKNHPTHYTAVVYVGPVEKWGEFYRVFSDIGHVVTPLARRDPAVTEAIGTGLKSRAEEIKKLGGQPPPKRGCHDCEAELGHVWFTATRDEQNVKLCSDCLDAEKKRTGAKTRPCADCGVDCDGPPTIKAFVVGDDDDRRTVCETCCGKLVAASILNGAPRLNAIQHMSVKGLRDLLINGLNVGRRVTTKKTRDELEELVRLYVETDCVAVATREAREALKPGAPVLVTWPGTLDGWNEKIARFVRCTENGNAVVEVAKVDRRGRYVSTGKPLKPIAYGSERSFPLSDVRPMPKDFKPWTPGGSARNHIVDGEPIAMRDRVHDGGDVEGTVCGWNDRFVFVLWDGAAGPAEIVQSVFLRRVEGAA